MRFASLPFVLMVLLPAASGASTAYTAVPDPEDTARIVLYAHTSDSFLLDTMYLFTAEPAYRDVAASNRPVPAGTVPQPSLVALLVELPEEEEEMGRNHDGPIGTGLEPGPAADIYLAGTTLMGRVFVSTASAPTTAVGLRIESRLESGRHPGEGRVYAYGEIATTVLGPSLGAGVLEVWVPMSIHDGVMRRDLSGVTWSVQVHELGPVLSPTPREWQVHTGSQYPTSLTLKVQRPLLASPVTLQEFEGERYARWSVQSPFGAYDVDQASLRLYVEERGELREARTLEKWVKVRVDHDGPNKPVNVTWSLGPVDEADGAPGTRLVATASNLQSSYEVRSASDWVRLPPAGASSPTLPFLGVLGILVGAAFVSRRP